MVMRKRWFSVFLIVLWLAIGAVPDSVAQQTASQQPSSEKQEEEKAALQGKAVVLLEQIVTESVALKLPENRIRLQITAADLLWAHNEERARGLFDMASASIIELIAKSAVSDNRQNFNGRPNYNNPYGQQNRMVATQLRQELVMTVARHNATLAYQFLQATQSPVTATDPNNRQANMEASLEQRLLGQIARTDPLLAMKNAEEMLDKGQYSSSFAQVLAQLQQKDKDAAARFSDKLNKRLQTENLLTNQEASMLLFSLLRPGPKPPEKSGDTTKISIANSSQVLSEAAFTSLLEAMVAAALKINLPPQGSGRGVNMGGGGPNNFRGGFPPQAGQSATATEQVAGRMLLSGLESLLPQIDKYLPARSTAVRQKLTQMGMDTTQRASFNQINELMQQGTSESFMNAAATAPANVQPMIYQQAATKALEEGNTDRARQIANDHLNGPQRNTILQRIEAQQLALKTGDDAMESIRQAIARLSSDEERLRMLLQLSATAQRDNPKLAVQILAEAQKLVSGRITSYQQFEAQLQVARAFAALDPARSFEVLEPGINQLNELFPAAALLSGFDVNIFKEGELPLQEGSRLSGMVNQYAQELANLAKSDFERAQMTAERFQLPEARVFTRLAIARGILSTQTAPGSNSFGNRGNGQNMPFGRRP
jgi:hypothetical protein